MRSEENRILCSESKYSGVHIASATSYVSYHARMAFEHAMRISLLARHVMWVEMRLVVVRLLRKVARIQ